MAAMHAAAGAPAGEGPGASLPAERRHGRRHKTVLKVAVLALGGGARRFCLVRNISDGGAMLEVDGAVAGERAAIELQPRSIEGRIVWAKDGHAGIAFAAPTDWAGLLRTPPASRKWRPRKPRIAIDRLAAVRVGWTRHFVGIGDISQGGLRVEGEIDAVPGTELVVTPDGLPPIRGSVRWRGEGACGVAFNEALPLRVLNEWLLDR